MMRPDVDRQVRHRCDTLIAQLKLPDYFQQVVDTVYLPLSRVIIDRIQTGPLLVSINGVQGSGKSTMTRFLKEIIEAELKAGVALLSLDDFYLKRDDRIRLAEQVHPLLATRGVPGTHEVALLEHVLESLLYEKACKIPVFDKASDDRCEPGRWTSIDQPVQIILFEGWCNNSPVQNETELLQPINDLERSHDADGVWRHYVNEQLQDYHARIFNRTHLSVMLQPPDFGCVYRWRSLQESKLRDAMMSKGAGEAVGSRVMGEQQLSTFIQHYERISRHTLSHLPHQADVVIPVAEDHSLTGVRLKLG